MECQLKQCSLLGTALEHTWGSPAMFGLQVTTRAGGHLLSSWNGKLGRSLTKTSTLRQGRIVFVLAISTRITFAWVYNNKARRRDADDAFEEARAWRIFSSFAIHMCSLLGGIERLQKQMTRWCVCDAYPLQLYNMHYVNMHSRT